MTESQVISLLDQAEESERYIHLTYTGWLENEILGMEERGEDEYSIETL